MISSVETWSPSLSSTGASISSSSGFKSRSVAMFGPLRSCTDGSGSGGTSIFVLITGSADGPGRG
jgi:hypothetical protein